MLATPFLLLMLDTVMLVFYLARNRAVYVLSLVFGLPLKWVLNGGDPRPLPSIQPPPQELHVPIFLVLGRGVRDFLRVCAMLLLLLPQEE